ncbi:DUF1929 domain-containing protein [Pseudonocardiaceae bacterium YIM PH 21723]|nr:DUF1929 domain-containing protein [Pseudonocardiaceae bacterium YIM PH 21723]
MLYTPLVLLPASAAQNLMPNPGFSQVDADGKPVCWQDYGWGENRSDYGLTAEKALRLTMSERTSGDRKVMPAQNTDCAPQVAAGTQYDLSLTYRTSTPNTAITLFKHTAEKGWEYWTDLSTLAVTGEDKQFRVRTPAIPAGVDQLSWGVTAYGDGEAVTRDYSMTAVLADPPRKRCQAGQACPKGQWDVLPYQSPVRGIHAVLLHTGKVLLIAGSGNDPSAFERGSFTSAVYDPAAGTFTSVPTPSDLFCSGHTQLADGRILVMGGNAGYPTEDGKANYKGLAVSYIFDPATNSYQRTNDLTAGHWYPSATTLGNGDVISLGGLDEKSEGSVSVEYFSQEKGRWLAGNEINQTWKFWGLYPSMILTAEGKLFYTGSHVFGNGLDGTGSSLYDYGSGTIRDVEGLQDKDNRDQSMSVLLPPAQDQRVLTLGGGNINTNVAANRHTDIIDLKEKNPRHKPGPQLPQGHMTDGTPQGHGEGKMYLSAVILPDGQVFETGGGLHNRSDPVFEASMFDPKTNTFTEGMATDPVPRGYHSSAFLLPDGRVLAVGNNPGDGSFDQRISVYSPSYLYKGTRSKITSVASKNWTYGSAQQITVDRPVAKAVLIRPAAVTHSSDPNQRSVDLPMAVDGDRLTLTVTANQNMAPPGWYMLFAVDADGVPSVAEWVRVGDA